MSALLGSGCPLHSPLFQGKMIINVVEESDGGGAEVIIDVNWSSTSGPPVINLFISFWLDPGDKADKLFVPM